MFASYSHGQGRHSWQGHPVLTMSAQLHPAARPGCHHPQLPDILAGALLGSAIACLYSAAADTLILRKKANRKRNRAA